MSDVQTVLILQDNDALRLIEKQEFNVPLVRDVCSVPLASPNDGDNEDGDKLPLENWKASHRQQQH